MSASTSTAGPQKAPSYPKDLILKITGGFPEAPPIAKSNRFQKYDWGRTRNVVIYGQPWPPQYNLSKVTAPVALYWSDGDVLAPPRDVADVARSLPNVVLNYKVPVPGFTQVDFGWTIRSKDHVYKKMLEMIIRYSQIKPKGFIEDLYGE